MEKSHPTDIFVVQALMTILVRIAQRKLGRLPEQLGFKFHPCLYPHPSVEVSYIGSQKKYVSVSAEIPADVRGVLNELVADLSNRCAPLDFGGNYGRITITLDSIREQRRRRTVTTVSMFSYATRAEVHNRFECHVS